VSDTTGCYIGTDGLWIETFTGKAFPVKDIQPELIDIDDIAHALSLTCRYAGHCKRFYSVAEHCCHVHAFLNAMGHPRSVQRSALLHDASEAYLGDVTRPLKVCLPDYRTLEKRLQGAIYERFDATPTSDAAEAIRQADNMVLKTEARELMASRGRLWNFGDLEYALVEIHGWSPEKAKQEFLERWSRR
jgi:uncharacterized protein